MKRTLFFMLLSAWLSAPAAWAYDFDIDGIYYNITSSDEKTVEVTYYLYDKYSGDVIIPATVTNEGIEYRVTAIGNSAFSWCYDLTSVTIGNNVTTISDESFMECTDLEKFKGKFTSSDNRCLIVNDRLVAFAQSGLSEYTIPEGVTTIGDWAFGGCRGLTSVTIPNSVTTIGERAFVACENLTSVTIPESVTSIGYNAFRGCTGLTEFKGKFAVDNCCLIVNATLKAFASNSGLSEYTIPDEVQVIGVSAFYGCTGLTEVTIGKNVQTIGESAFYGCTGLSEVTIPESVTTIGDDAFRNCSGLTSVTIGKNVQTIGESAFYDCTGLSEITIPESVTTIGDEAFRDCSGLTSVTIPNSVTSIGKEAFYGCTGLKKVYISDLAAWCRIDFKKGGSNPLYYAHNLYENNTLVTDLKIPNDITKIYPCAFYGCTSLISVTIPEGVTSIGDWAFYCCTGLTSVTAYNPTPVNIDESVFYNVDCSNCTLYVATESVELYKAVTWWKEFGTVSPIDESSAIMEIRQDKADGHITVYNLQGVPVLETDDAADLKTLQNGTYIVNGKTMIIAR